MQYYFTATQPITVTLPDYVATEKIRNANGSIIVQFVATFATILSDTVAQSITIAGIAKGGIKGIEEWAQILKQVPALITLFTRIFTDIVQDADEFAQAIVNITPLEKAQATAVFIEKFNLQNDKAEAIVEKIFSIALELIGVLKLVK